jgi:hypothetical protein
MWKEEENKKEHYRSFRKEKTMYILHFIRFSNKDAYMVINENAFDVPKPQLSIMTAKEVLNIYNIKL